MAPNKEDTVVPPGDCKASASIINVAKKYVKNELKTLASVQLGKGNQDWSFSRNSRAGILPVPTMDRQDAGPY